MQPEYCQTMPGEVLSPSQAACYLSCSARWRFRYILGLPDPAGGGAVRGKAVHKAVEYYMRAKLAGVVLDAPAVMNNWDVMWDEASEGAEFAAGQSARRAAIEPQVQPYGAEGQPKGSPKPALVCAIDEQGDGPNQEEKP